MNRYCLLVDLVDDPGLIATYEQYHRNVWPEILRSISDSGILQMEIYRVGNRMSMFIEAADWFTFEKKSSMDASDPVVQKWESLMAKYQQQLPIASGGEKWMRTEKIFDLASAKNTNDFEG